MKFAILEQHARNFEPSTDSKAPLVSTASATASLIARPNARKTPFRHVAFSLRNLAIVLKSGLTPSTSHMTSTFVSQARASLLEERIWLQLP